MIGCQFSFCLDNYLGPDVKGRPRNSVVHKDYSALKLGFTWYKLAQDRQA